MKLKKTIEEIKQDILKNNFKVTLNELTNDTCDISSAFGEIFIRISGDTVIRLEYVNDFIADPSYEQYREIIEYALKNWINI